MRRANNTSRSQRTSALRCGERELLVQLVGAPTDNAQVLFVSLATSECLEKWRARPVQRVRLRLRGA